MSSCGHLLAAFVQPSSLLHRSRPSLWNGAAYNGLILSTSSKAIKTVSRGMPIGQPDLGNSHSGSLPRRFWVIASQHLKLTVTIPTVLDALRSKVQRGYIRWYSLLPTEESAESWGSAKSGMRAVCTRKSPAGIFNTPSTGNSLTGNGLTHLWEWSLLTHSCPEDHAYSHSLIPHNGC